MVQVFDADMVLRDDEGERFATTMMSAAGAD